MEAPMFKKKNSGELAKMTKGLTRERLDDNIFSSFSKLKKTFIFGGLMSISSRERPEKILVAMFRVTEGKIKPLNYEDIVVEAFKLFPDEFALRGYPQYPDSSDIHKPLYGPLKRKGLVMVANKRFSLTQRGLEFARSLIETAGTKIEEQRDPNRLPPDVRDEVNLMLKSDAVAFFKDGQQSKIIDTDFYTFIGCTVRTERNLFIGRMKTIEDAIAACLKLKQPSPETAALLAEVFAFLKDQFNDIISRKRSS
jgi:hypothetical protein